MLRLENISMAFGKNMVLDNLSEEVKNGDFITIVGANGSGKSTLFNVISGKIKPTSGNVFINGKNVTIFDEAHRSNFISRLFQNTSMGSVPTLNVEENLALALFKNKKVSLKNALTNLKNINLEELLKPLNLDLNILLKTNMSDLSGGQRQMISFLMTTLTPPPILLLDEPTAALDPSSSTKLLLLAKNFIEKHKITTLLITHDPQIALKLGNKLWIMENGKIKKQFECEKSNLSAKHLIGQIDYEILN